MHTIKLKKLKEIYAKQAWRIRQSQSIVSLVFYSLTLAGIYIPYIKKFTNIPELVLIPLSASASMVFLLLLGIFYDVGLNLWKEENTVVVEKNPYNIDKFAEKELEVMKLSLAGYKIFLEGFKSNLRLCEKLDIPASDLKKEIAELEKKVAIYEEWIKAGKITKKIM